jgi:hypothetical protein
MKKLLVLFLVSASLLTVSCKKENTVIVDDAVKLAGTSWKSTLTLGGFNAQYLMAFINDSIGRMDMSIVEGGLPDTESLTFAYVFDGKSSGTITVDDDENMPFTYSDGSGNPVITMMLTGEEARELGINQLVFTKQ